MEGGLIIQGPYDHLERPCGVLICGSPMHGALLGIPETGNARTAPNRAATVSRA